LSPSFLKKDGTRKKSSTQIRVFAKMTQFSNTRFRVGDSTPIVVAGTRYIARAAWTARSRADTAMVRRRAADTLPSAHGGRMLSTGVLELAARTPFEDPAGEDGAVYDHQDHGR
jgi:hypothetical protein